jgi:hypothetical protein
MHVATRIDWNQCTVFLNKVKAIDQFQTLIARHKHQLFPELFRQASTHMHRVLK